MCPHARSRCLPSAQSHTAATVESAQCGSVFQAISTASPFAHGPTGGRAVNPTRCRACGDPLLQWELVPATTKSFIAGLTSSLVRIVPQKISEKVCAKRAQVASFSGGLVVTRHVTVVAFNNDAVKSAQSI